MSLTARKVLGDCKNAHTLLEDELDTVRFRLFWVAGVELLRSVGHVLHKMDAMENPRFKVAVDVAYEDWKRDKTANAIFWEFIEEERNNLLKEYEIGFLSGPVTIVTQPHADIFELDENLYCPIADG